MASASIWMSFQASGDPDRKPRVFRTRVLDVSEKHIYVEQPFEAVAGRHVGRVFCLSWIERDDKGALVRRMLDARLAALDSFRLEGGATQALVFDPPLRYYSGSLRRHYRVAVPLEEDICVEVKTPDGRAFGPRIQYPIVDLCLFGLRFSCTEYVLIKGKPVPDPVSRLQARDRVRLAVFIENMETVRAEAAVRTVLRPFGADSNVVHFGVEFMRNIEIISTTGGERLLPFNDAHSDRLAPHIYRFQRMTLRKERGVS